MKASKTDINGKARIRVDSPWNRTIAEKMSAISGAVWSKTLGAWHLPYNKETFHKNYPGNLNLIRDYFRGRIRELTVHNEYQANTGQDTIISMKTNQLLMVKTINGRIKLIFPFNHALANFIRKFPLSKWDAKNQHEAVLHEIDGGILEGTYGV